MSSVPFSPHGMYGFGWRRNRQFVGRVMYGVKYLLWQPSQSIHDKFPLVFRQAVDTMLLIDYKHFRLSMLPEHVVWYIINFLPYNWVIEGNAEWKGNASVVSSVKRNYSAFCKKSRSCVLQWYSVLWHMCLLPCVTSINMYVIIHHAKIFAPSIRNQFTTMHRNISSFDSVVQ